MAIVRWKKEQTTKQKTEKISRRGFHTRLAQATQSVTATYNLFLNGNLCKLLGLRRSIYGELSYNSLTKTTIVKCYKQKAPHRYQFVGRKTQPVLQTGLTFRAPLDIPNNPFYYRTRKPAPSFVRVAKMSYDKTERDYICTLHIKSHEQKYWNY